MRPAFAWLQKRRCPPGLQVLNRWNAWLPSSSNPQAVALPMESVGAGAMHWLVPASVAALVAATSARAALCDAEDSESTLGKLPSTWRERIGSGARLVQLPEPEREAQQTDKSFIRQTCRGPRMIEQLQILECPRREDVQNGQLDESDTVPGQTRLCTVLRVGDAVNGHPQTIHGGFTAAVLDELFGVATWLEKNSQFPGEEIRILTANLHVNYRRPMPCNRQYLVEVDTTCIVRNKKVYLRAIVFDAKGRACVESTSLYILKRPPPS